MSAWLIINPGLLHASLSGVGPSLVKILRLRKIYVKQMKICDLHIKLLDGL